MGDNNDADKWAAHKGEVQWVQERTIEIEQKSFLFAAENICNHSRYPLVALRLLIHIICGTGPDGKTHISARQMSKMLDVHYDTVTKCLKYLRQIEVLRIER